MSMRRDYPPLSAAASLVRKSVFAALQARIDAFRTSGGELIPLQIGDTYLDPPPESVAAVANADGRDLSIYGAVPGLSELRAAIAGRLMERGYPIAVEACNVHVGCGCTHALFCAARAVLNPGDEVLVTAPYWPLIMGVLQTAGAKPIEVTLRTLDGGEPVDVRAALEAARSERTRAVYYVSPNNPDGHVLADQELEVIAQFARDHDLWVVADEVYADFVYDGVHRSIAGRDGLAERTIASYSLSKSYGLAGARIGFVVASERVIDATRRMSNHTVYNVPVPMQRAALAALQSGSGWIDAARVAYKAARDRTCAALDALELRYRKPAGGSFVFVDLRERLGGRPLEEFLQGAVDEGVLLAPGRAFGEDFAGFARLCFTGAPIEDVLLGVERIGRVLERWPP